MDNVSAVARGFVGEKIRDLEKKLKADEGELRRKQSLISELEAQLEATKINGGHQIQVEEISVQ
uniref:Centrosomal protein of 63 kDa isoform X2 n=1 Tax=Rhizophora mucronata TaxID=61149 RepID=A0A2P2IKP7_RHIMU